MAEELTQERLKQVLAYVPETGRFLWFDGRKIKIPSNPTSYLTIWIDGRRYPAHRLAWLYVHGKWPLNMIDHINGVPTDNRICNLRCATHSENARNQKKSIANTTGFKGVHRKGAKWVARVNGQFNSMHLGCFSTPEEAYAAYCKAAEALHGEFVNTGEYKRVPA